MRRALATLLLPLALASPTPFYLRQRQSDIDTDVLNFALSVEYLSSALYTEGLAQFDDSSFSDAGYPSWVRGRLSQVSAHETTHISTILSLLPNSTSSPSPSACTYSFPLTSPSSFVALSASLSAITSSVYVGLTELLTSAEARMAVAGIGVVEGRHQGWVASAVLKGAGWSGAVETPLDVDQAWTLLSAYITSCPSSNPSLPVTAFPALTIPQASISTGSSITLQFTPTSTSTAQYYAAFFYGLSSIFVPVAHDNSVSVPENLYGTVYLLVTTSNSSVTDGNTVAGPTILNFPFDSFEVVGS